jgi:hypothetical protein
MGWMGYGLYDGDDTLSCQTEAIDIAIGGKNPTYLLENGKKTDCYSFLPKMKLDSSIREIIDKNYPLIKNKLNLSNHDLNESRAIAWQMLADLYMNQGMDMPPELIEKALEATEYLKKEHAEDFDNPSARKKVLNNFIKKINTYTPKHVKTKEQVIDEILTKTPNNSKYFEKTVTLLFNNGLKSIQSLTNNEKFEAPNYFNIPKSITSNLNKKEITTISEICNNELSTFFRAEVYEYSKAYKNLEEAQQVFTKTISKLKLK